MTEPAKESGSEAEGTTEVKPDPAVPQFSGDKQSSGAGEADPQALAKALVPAIKKLLIEDEDFIRAGQSVKDRRFKALDEFPLEELRKLKKYAEKYGDEDEAFRQIQIDRELLARQQPQQGTSTLPSPDQGKVQREEGLQSWVSRQLQSVKIDPSDPEYEALVDGFKEGGDEGEFRAAVRVLIAQRKAAQASSDVNVQPERGGIQKSGTLSESALRDAFVAEMRGARGQGMDVGRAIKEKYRQKGLDVDVIPLI